MSRWQDRLESWNDPKLNKTVSCLHKGKNIDDILNQKEIPGKRIYPQIYLWLQTWPANMVVTNKDWIQLRPIPTRISCVLAIALTGERHHGSQSCTIYRIEQCRPRCSNVHHCSDWGDSMTLGKNIPIRLSDKISRAKVNYHEKKDS